MTKQEHQAKWATIDQAIGAEQWGDARAQLMHLVIDIIVRAQLSALKRMVSDRSVELGEHLPPPDDMRKDSREGCAHAD